MAEKYFKNPFAVLGDKEAVPDDSVNTLVSYETGYTPEYELDPDTDPNGNFVGRQRMNQLFADITGNLKQWQDTGYPEFVADDGTGSPLSYTAGRIVELNGVYYRANTATNTAPPSAQWDTLGSADGFEQSLADNGWQKLPSGLIIQWAQNGDSASNTTFTASFPITFPNLFLAASVTDISTSSSSTSSTPKTIEPINNSSYRIWQEISAPTQHFIIAIGY